MNKTPDCANFESVILEIISEGSAGVIRVECCKCKKQYEVTRRSANQSFDKNGYIICNDCSLARKATNKNIDLYHDLIIGDIPIKQSSPVQIKCTKCDNITKYSAFLSYIRGRREGTELQKLGWCRNCIMGSKEVQNKLQVTWGGQRGKPGKKKTEKEKLKTSQAVKDYYAANPDRRIILSEQMRKAWENPKFLEGMKNSEEIRLQNMKLANCSKDFKRDQSERMKLKWQETEFSSRVREISRRNALNNMDKLHYWASTKEGSEHISKRVKEGWKTEE